MLFLLAFLLQILFCLVVYLLVLTHASWQFAIFYNTVSFLEKNFYLISLIFSKIVKTYIDLLAKIALAGNCPTYSICCIAFLILFVYSNQLQLVYSDFWCILNTLQYNLHLFLLLTLLLHIVLNQNQLVGQKSSFPW